MRQPRDNLAEHEDCFHGDNLISGTGVAAPPLLAQLRHTNIGTRRLAAPHPHIGIEGVCPGPVLGAEAPRLAVT